MATPFENFVSQELPKRLATNEDPLTVPEGMVPVTTGVGLLTKFQPSGGSIINIAAVESLGGHRAVLAAGLYADNVSLSSSIVIGITTEAVTSGSNVIVQASGEMTEPSWLWDISKPVYLGQNGLLTQIVPTTGVIVEIGRPIANNKLLIKIQSPIVLA
jgi:hypothetical protein